MVSRILLGIGQTAEDLGMPESQFWFRQTATFD
jgi:hypothetical protein